jgi:hypothetical protein
MALLVSGLFDSTTTPRKGVPYLGSSPLWDRTRDSSRTVGFPSFTEVCDDLHFDEPASRARRQSWE